MSKPTGVKVTKKKATQKIATKKPIKKIEKIEVKGIAKQIPAQEKPKKVVKEKPTYSFKFAIGEKGYLAKRPKSEYTVLESISGPKQGWYKVQRGDKVTCRIKHELLLKKLPELKKVS